MFYPSEDLQEVLSRHFFHLFVVITAPAHLIEHAPDLGYVLQPGRRDQDPVEIAADADMVDADDGHGVVDMVHDLADTGTPERLEPPCISSQAFTRTGSPGSAMKAASTRSPSSNKAASAGSDRKRSERKAG